jgi:membrane-bound ClpP family serine protease
MILKQMLLRRINPAARWLVVCFWLTTGSVLGMSQSPQTAGAVDQSATNDSQRQGSNDEAESELGATDRSGVLINIPLPVDSASAEKIKLSLKRIVESAPAAVRPDDRLAVVLEFDTDSGKTGRGSELEACQMLARFLATAEMNRVETIAYIPACRRPDPAFPDQMISNKLIGHAVLIALATHRIAMDEGTSIGSAGIDEPHLDTLVRAVYRGIASQRLTIPVPMVMAMVDKDQALYRVRTEDKTVYVAGDELRELESKGGIIETTTLSDRGKMAELTSRQLNEFLPIRFLLVSDREDLERKLNLPVHALESSPAFSGAWRAVSVKFPAYIDARTAQWVMRSLGTRLAAGGRSNLVILDFDETDGDLDACLTLARYLVDLDEDAVQTVAFINGSARGPVGLLALCCDQLIMADDARLGGHLNRDGEAETAVSSETLVDLQPMIEALARDQRSDWSLLMAMLDSNLPVIRVRHNETLQLRLLSPAELESTDRPDDWTPVGPVDVEEGITAAAAEQMFVARTVVADRDELHRFYQLKEEPSTLEPSATDQLVERVAGFLSNPGVSMLLLFAAMFFMSSEMSAPGLGVPGFLGALCFMLFFWSQYLDGNAHWLEIILFLAGVVFVGIEIFAIPGFGVFGIGGMLMIVVSLVLASQNFLIPQTNEQINRLPASLLPVLGAGFGLFAAIFTLRKVLPNSPYFKNLMLAPRESRFDTGLEGDGDPESIVDWSHLLGQQGETITRLVPSGKARISGKVYDVITDGRMIDKGHQVTVIEAIGNRVVVKPVGES